MVVLNVVEDGQGFGPGVAGGSHVAGGVAGVAEVVEDDGGAVAFFGLGQQAQGLLVAAGGLGMLAELVVDVADAVPGAGFIEPVA